MPHSDNILCRLLMLPALFAICLSHSDAGGKADETKEVLQEIQDIVGSWKGICTPEKNRNDFWAETAEWSWKFRDKDIFFAARMPKGKLYKSATLHYLPAKDRYQLKLTDKSGQELVFEGPKKKKTLVLERADPKTKEVQQYMINTASEGDRLIFTLNTKPANRTLFFKTHQIAYTREGVTFASAGNKKNECVVTGGLGTMAVSFGGATYYVCCSGCRDAFNDNPEKIIKEYLARKKAGK